MSESLILHPSSSSLPDNPFPGLRPFREDEHHLFFGREEQTAELLRLLRTNRFLAVVGTSGSGKSSLVRSGLIAELHSGTMARAGSAWEIAILRPGGSPVQNLARAMVEADLYDADDSNTLPRLMATLGRSRFGLVEAVKQSDVFEPGTNLLVVVDQFEELFRFRGQGVGSEEEAAAFVNLLLTASEQDECPIYVALTMRSDYLGDCSEVPGLAQAVNRGEYLIPRLMRDQKRDAIEKPVGVGGARISPLLVQRLLNEVGDDADQLPVLQHALMRMWDAWFVQGDPARPIEFTDFEATGGLSSALSKHADEIFDSLPDDAHRTACERVFKALTERGADNRGIRRPTRLAQLQSITQTDRETLLRVLGAYRRPGVTFLMPGLEQELDDRTVIDLSHESLMRCWTRLRDWVEEEEAQSARIFRRLLDTARLWLEDKAGLYRDPDLQIALAWRDQEAPNESWSRQYGGRLEEAVAFLDKSAENTRSEERAREAARRKELEQARKLAETEQQRAEEQSRSAVRLRWLVRLAGLVAMIAVAAMIMAWSASQEARTNADIAGRESEEARRQKETAVKATEATRQALTQVAAAKETAEASLQKAEIAERRSREFLYATDIQLAARLADDDKASAGKLLAQLQGHDPDANPDLSIGEDLRGFEWHYLKGRVDARAVVFRGFESDVIGAAVNDRNELVTLEKDGRLTRWSAETRDPVGAPLNLKQGRDPGILALSPDGARAALAIGNRVHLMDARTGEERVRSLPCQARIGMLFSPDNRMLVTVDSVVGWWDVTTGKAIALADSRIPIRSGPVSLSGDGLTLAVGGITARFSSQLFSIFRLDAATREIHILQDKRNAGVGSTRTLALSPDGKSLLVSQFFSGSLYRYSTDDKKVGHIVSRSEHSASVSAMAFHPDDGRLVTADLDGTARLWDSGGSSTGGLTAHAQQVDTISFVRGSNRVISSGKDGTVRLWDLDQSEATSRRRTTLASGGMRAAYSPEGLLVMVSEGDGGHLKIRDPATGKAILALAGSDDGVKPHSVAFSPDGRLLAVGFGGLKDQSHIELWDIDRRERLAVMPGSTDIPGYTTSEDTGIVSGLAFSPDGRHLAAGFGSLTTLSGGDRGDFPVKIYDVAKRRMIRRLAGPRNYVIAVKYSKDGSRLACACFDGNAYVWDTASWQLSYGPLSNPDSASDVGKRRVQDVAFSPDGRFLAMASAESNVHIWNAATGERVETLNGHGNIVWCVAFSPDGRTLASGSADNTIRLWNRATWREVLTLDDTRNPRSLAFSPDGFDLLSAGFAAFQWSARSPDEEGAERLAKQLGALLNSRADFASRLRMLSERPSLREALERLAARETNSIPVQSALAASRADWRASREEWKEAAAQFDQLKDLGAEPGDWLRTPGALRLATALLHADRPTEAASLLTGGEKQRAEDGNARRVVGFGDSYAVGELPLKLTQVFRGSPSWKAGLRPGDILLKYNDVELNEDNAAEWNKLRNGPAGTKLAVTFQKPGQDQPRTVQVVKANYIHDDLTVGLVEELLAAIESKQSDATNAPGLFELRAELAGQSSDYALQVTHYTAAIEGLEKQEPKRHDDLHRLHARRGAAHAKLGNWHAVAADLDHALVDGSSDFALRSLRAMARAELLSTESVWRRLPSQDIGLKGTTVARVEADGSMKRARDASSGFQTEAVGLKLPPDLTKPRALLVEWPEPGKAYEKGRPDFLVELLDAPVSTNGSLIGRFVRLDLPVDNERFPGPRGDGGMRMINLAELQVFQGGANIAAGKTARQSSTLGGGVADRAVDGNTDGSHAARSFAHTVGGSDPNPWWEVDLGAEQAMDRIVIWNRNGWHDRMKHFRIQVLDKRRRVVFATYSAKPPRPSLTIQTIAISAPSDHARTNRISLRLAALPSTASKYPPRLSVSESPFAMERLDLNIHGVETNFWRRLAIALIDRDNHKALVQLVADNPEAAGPVGDLFVGGQLVDRRRAIEIYSLGVGAANSSPRPGLAWSRETGDSGWVLPEANLLAKRARAYEGLKNWDAAAADWALVAQTPSGGPKIQCDFANRLEGADQYNLAAKQRELARASLEATLEADPGDMPAIERLAELLIDHAVPRIEWQPLKPASLRTAKGASLSVLEDDSLRIERGRHRLTFAGGDLVKAVRIQTASATSTPDGDVAPLKEYRILSTDMPTNGFHGRYVRLDLPGANKDYPRSNGDRKMLNLAEVQVFQGTENIAQGKPARQSSVYSDNSASRAVDGNTSGDAKDNSIAHTHDGKDGSQPWWEVDLGAITDFDRLVVWNRTGGYQRRMSWSRIQVLDGSRTVVFERFIEEPPDPSREIRREILLSPFTPAAPDGEGHWRVDLGASLRHPFRISKADELYSIERVEAIAEARRISPRESRLAAAYDILGATKASVVWFGRALAEAKTDRQRTRILETLQNHPRPLEAMLQLAPDDLNLQIARARSLVRHGKKKSGDEDGAKALENLKQARTIFEAALAKRPEPNGIDLKPAELAALDLVIGLTHARRTNVTEAAASLVRALERALEPAERMNLIGQFPPQEAILIRLTETFPGEPALQLALARRRADAGKEALAGNRLEEALRLLNKSREIFGRLSSRITETKATVLEPAEMSSEGRAKLTLQKDGSIFVSEPGLEADTYVLTMPIEDPDFTVIHLETLPDERLPGGGAGFRVNGNFMLGEIKFEWLSGDEKPATPLIIDQAVVDWAQPGYSSIEEAFDGNPETYWAVNPRFSEPHWALFFLDPASVRAKGEQRLRITIRSGTKLYSDGTLGRFRLSVSSDLKPRDALVHRELKASRLGELELALGKALVRQGRALLENGRADEADAAFSRALDASQDLRFRMTLIAETADQPGVLERLAKLKAGDAPFLNALARHHQSAGDARKAKAAAAAARSLYEDQLKAPAPDPRTLIQLADLLLDVNTAPRTGLKPIVGQESIPAIKAIGEPRLRLGAAYAFHGDLERAENLVARSLERASNSTARESLANQAVKFDQVFARLLTRFPNDPALSLARAGTRAPALYNKGEYQAAIELLTDALKVSPEAAVLFSLRGENFMALLQWEPALADWRRAAELWSDNGRRRTAVKRQADCLIQLGQFQEAADILFRETQLNSGSDSLFAATASQLLAGEFSLAKYSAGQYARQTGSVTTSGRAHDLLLAMTARPGWVNQQNRNQLLRTAEKISDPRKNTLARKYVHFRLGQLREAPADLLQAGGPIYRAFRTMLLCDKGRIAESRAELAALNAELREIRYADPDSVIPPSQDWKEWAVTITLAREAADKVAGPRFVELDQLLKGEPDNLEARLERASLLVRIGWNDEALADLEHARKLNVDPKRLVGLRGRILAGLERDEEALTALRAAIEDGSDDAEVYEARAGVWLRQGETLKARADLRRSMELEPSEAKAGALGDQLLAEAATRIAWEVLTPTVCQSKGGADLELLEDGSILASGDNPDRDVYMVIARPGLTTIAGIRLEALPDDSLPKNGPGRTSINGNFHLNEFRAFSGGDAATLNGVATYYDEKGKAKSMIDGKLDSDMGWSNHPKAGQANSAVFRADFQREADADLKFELHFARNQWKDHNLGRFRLSVTDNPNAFDLEKQRLAAASETNVWTRLAGASRLLGETTP